MFHYLLFRYQIIGYQIISGHIVHNTEHDNREREQDSQSGAEGEEASEQSGAEDTTREMSGTVEPLLEGHLFSKKIGRKEATPMNVIVLSPTQ